MQVKSFYNRFQQKNSHYHKQIGEENFTYFLHLQLLRPILGVLKNRARVLDIGCGVGPLTLYSALRAKYVVGVDVSDRAIKIAKDAQSKLGVANALFMSTTLTKKIGEFSLIIVSEVLEHVADDCTFAKLLAVNLEKNGWLLLTTPSSENLFFHLGWYRGFDERVGHFRRYTKSELVSLLHETGFEVVFLRQAESVLRNILFTTRLGFLIRFIRGPLIPIFHVVDTWFGTIFGWSNLQVLAQKK